MKFVVAASFMVGGSKIARADWAPGYYLFLRADGEVLFRLANGKVKVWNYDGEDHSADDWKIRYDVGD